MEKKVVQDIVSSGRRVSTPPPVQPSSPPPTPPSTPPASDAPNIVVNRPKEPAQTFLTRERREERRGGSFETQQSLEYKASRPAGKKKWIVLGALILLLGGGFAYASATNSANVIVTPKSSSKDIDASIKAYKTPDAPNLLAFSTLELSAEATAKVPASGTKYAERKASGKITVTNGSTESLKLIANTRFKSESGQIFRAPGAINIAAGKSLEISVLADAPGAEYNIAPTNFSVPGLAGGALASVVTGKSTTAFTGGFKGDVKIVSDSDLATARTSLEGSLTQKLLDQVAANIDASKVFFPDAYSVSFTFNELPVSPSNEGDKAEDSNTQDVVLSGKITAVIFNKEELSSTLARRELSDAGEEPIDISNWQDITASISNSEDLTTASDINIRLTGKANFVWKVDEEKIKSELANIPKDAYPSVFINHPAVLKAEVEIKPFWRAKFPSDPARIHIIIPAS